MIDKEALEKFSTLSKEGDFVMSSCYDPDCPFAENLKVGEKPVKIEYNSSGEFSAKCVAYDDFSDMPCDVPRQVLGDLELNL